jgi:hypothetical protein
MKNPLISLTIVFTTMLSCTQKPQGATTHNDTDSTKNMTNASLAAAPFDLAKLTLKEKIVDLLTAQGIKPKPKEATDQTLLDFEVAKTSDPKVLRFNGKDFSASQSEVLFHYRENDKTLGFYELKLHSEQQAGDLITELDKVGKQVFKKTGTAKGSIELDENGNEVKPGKGETKKYFVWENAATGVSFYLIETGSGQNFDAELTALKPSEQSGKDWIAFRSFDWYKKQ